MKRCILYILIEILLHYNLLIIFVLAIILSFLSSMFSPIL